MINVTDITGLAGATLAITASLLLVPPIRRLKRIHIVLLMSVTAIIVAVPIGALPLAAYIRSCFGDPSITTNVLLVMAIFSNLSGRRPVDEKQKFVMNGLIAVTALVFYPLALGIGPFDPYRLGYGSLGFLTALFMLALCFWAVRFYLISICIALSVVTHAMAWYESTNLWDYLLDPLVSVYALVAVLAGGLRTTTHPGGQNSHELPAPPQDGVESTRCP
jgi:hypothetical protein